MFDSFLFVNIILRQLDTLLYFFRASPKSKFTEDTQNMPLSLAVNVFRLGNVKNGGDTIDAATVRFELHLDNFRHFFWIFDANISACIPKERPISPFFPSSETQRLQKPTFDCCLVSWVYRCRGINMHV